MEKVEQYSEAIGTTDRVLQALWDLKERLYNIYDGNSDIEKRDFLYSEMRMLSHIVWDLTGDEGIRAKLVTWQRKVMEG